MIPRSLLAAALLALPLLPGAACAQGQPADPAAQPQAPRQASPAARPFGGPGPQAGATTRIPKTLNEPLGLRPPPSATPSRGPDLAPVPNRSIEAPPDRLATSGAATLEPMLLPQDRRTGMTFGREHLRETGPDRPFDAIVPGARLRIPFDGSQR